MVLSRKPKKDDFPPVPIEPTRNSILSRLKGTVRTHGPMHNKPNGTPWGNVSRYAAQFEDAGKKEGVDPLLLAGMAIVESNATHFREDGSVVVRASDGYDNYPAIGMMQVKAHYHQWRDPNANVYKVDGNIRLATLIIADGIRRFGSWQKALVNLYFPGDDVNGTSQGGYISFLVSVMQEMRNQTQPGPIPDPDPPKPPKVLKEPLDVIFGGRKAYVEYGFLDDVGLNYYGYGVNHGTSRPTQHTGDDVLVPDETPLYSPAPGIVTCVGWKGNPTWGQGCGHFEDSMGGGVGNISVLLDVQRKVVFGHSSSAAVKVGQRVSAGEQIGRSGGMNGPHTHLEVAVSRKGTYWLVDPQPELREAMKGSDPLPPEKLYADPVDIPQPDSFDRYAKVTAIKSGVPVLQRADPSAEHTRKPLEAGETFDACYQVLGVDGKIYWITSRKNRIPLIGTESKDWPE